MIWIARFLNPLMNSNCYVIHQEQHKECVVIDPAAEKCENILPYLEANNIVPKFVLLTHEHVDHTWGCNYLREEFGAKVLCSRNCAKYMNVNSRSYFQLYYDQCDYEYQIAEPDQFVEEGFRISLCGVEFVFFETSGHSAGSVCIEIKGENTIIGGDVLMKTKPYISKPTGNKQLFEESIMRMKALFPPTAMVYPGHGEPFELANVNMDF